MEGEIIDTLEKEEEQQEVVELPGVTALKILGKTNHSSIYANNGKVADENDSNIKTRKNMDNNVNNKYMLDALLNAVGISDDVINKQNEDDMKAKKKEDANNSKPPIFPPNTFNSLLPTPTANDNIATMNNDYVLLNNKHISLNNESNDDEGSDAGSDWGEDTNVNSTAMKIFDSDSNTANGNNNNNNKGTAIRSDNNNNNNNDKDSEVITIGVTPRQKKETNTSIANEEKTMERNINTNEEKVDVNNNNDRGANDKNNSSNDNNKLNNLLQALQQLPGIASPDEARNWGPVPWGRFSNDNMKIKKTTPAWSFPLLQTPLSSPEPIRTNLLNPSIIASREAVRRRAIIFSPLNVDPRNNKNNEALRKYPRVAYDWREAQESTTNAVSAASKSPKSKNGNYSNLKFDSRFECGNLLRAVQIAPYEYDLFVRADVNTKSYMQWWYFAVKNTHTPNWKDLAVQKANRRKEQAWGGVNSSGVNIGNINRGSSREPTSLGVNPSGSVTIKFNIVNLCKPDSMYNKGMQPILYSCFEAENAGIGWRRAGSDICYFGNQYTRVDSKGNHYTLTFKITFQNPNDTVLLAHSPPYTYTDNLRHMKELTKNRGKCIRRSVLCKTLAERQCDLLTITDFEEPEDPKRRRRAIVMTARVHPGETPASWIMKGFLDFVTGTSAAAKLLRTMFVFKVVPMLNPDGVFYGNNRCNLSGVDLNRQWAYPSPLRHPTIYYTKNMIRELRTIRPVVLYLDIHAHSRKNNIFMYGVEDKNRPTPSRRIVPLLMSKGLFSHKYFSYRDCHFKVTPGRESTARVVVARELHVANSYTVESTYCGSNQGPLAGKQFNVGHWELFGMGMADTMLQMYHTDGDKRSHVQKCLALLQASLYHRSSGSSNTRRQQREDEAAEKALALILENNPGTNGENVESLIIDKASNDFNFQNLKGMGDKLGLGVGKVTTMTPQRRSSDSFLYTTFQEQKFIQAAEFEDFEIYQEVFSPNVPKEETKKDSRNRRKNARNLHTNGRHATIRNSSNNKHCKQGNAKKKKCSDNGKKGNNNTNNNNNSNSNSSSSSSIEKLNVDDTSSNDGLDDDSNGNKNNSNTLGVKKVFGNSGKIIYPSEKQRFDNKRSDSNNTYNNDEKKNADKSKIMYASSNKQDNKELMVKKRDIQMQVPGDTGMNFVVPPYKPLKLKRSSNFGNILHNLRTSTRRTSSAPNNSHNDDASGKNIAIEGMLISDGEMSTHQVYNEAYNGTVNKEKNLIPLRMPQIGFVQEKTPTNMLMVDNNNDNNNNGAGTDANNLGNMNMHDQDVAKVARQPAIRTKIKRSRRARRRGNNKQRVNSKRRSGGSSGRSKNNPRTTAQDIKRMLKSKLQSGRKNKRKNSSKHSSGGVNNNNLRFNNNNRHQRNHHTSGSMNGNGGGGDDAIFLPSVGHAVSHANPRKFMNHNHNIGGGELTPLSPNRASQKNKPSSNRVRGFIFDSKGTRGRVYRNYNDLPNFSPVRSRPAFT